MNIGTPAITPVPSKGLVGQVVTETASIAYDGTLLPAGTGVDPTKRYLKDKGKDKNHILVESGQGKFFNGTNQYINTGIIPNQAQGTLVTRFTHASSGNWKTPIGTQHGGVANARVGITDTGKIYACYGNNGMFIYTTYTAIVGRSYHVALKYSGTDFSLYIDGALYLSSTATANSITNFPLFVGANNSAGNANHYFNSVIDETYYYDVALTDTQIMSLYQYPEKITTNTASGIVPDIGNVDNCKLFLPMSESGAAVKNNTVVNVAIPYSSELLPSGNFDSSASWGIGTGWVISNGVVTHTGVTASALSYPFVPTVDKYYNIEVIVSALSGAVCYPAFTGGTTVAGNNLTLGTNNIIIKALTGNINFYLGMSMNGDITVNNISVKEVSAFPIANFTAACVDSAKQLSYGAQCIAWKRDALGVPLGMSNGLSFDGGSKSVKKVTSSYTPALADSFAIDVILPKNNSVQRDCGLIGTVLFRMTATNTVKPYVFSQTATESVAQTENYKLYSISYNGTTKLFSFYVAGALVSTSSVVASVVGGVITIGETDINIEGFYKIHKGAQFTKWDAVKAQAKALKQIAKLGA